MTENHAATQNHTATTDTKSRQAKQPKYPTHEQYIVQTTVPEWGGTPMRLNLKAGDVLTIHRAKVEKNCAELPADSERGERVAARCSTMNKANELVVIGSLVDGEDEDE